MIAARRLLWNPIVEKEVLSRMRSWRAPFVITIFLALQGLIGFLALLAATASQSFSGPSGPIVGRAVFGSLAFTALVLMIFIVPALTAGAISGERERQTLDLLLCTRVRPFGIVTGKLLSSLMFVILLLVVSVPLFSVVFLFGGVELDQVVTVLLVGLVSALVLGSIGLLASTAGRSSTGSTVTSYAATVVFLGLPLAAPVVQSALDAQHGFYRVGTPIYQLANPIVVIQAALTAPSANVGPNTAFNTGGAVGGRSCTTSGNVTTCQGTTAPGRGVLGVVPTPGPAPNQLDTGWVQLSGDAIVKGPLTGWHAWQVFTLTDLVFTLLLLLAASGLLSRRALRPRRRASAIDGEFDVPPVPVPGGGGH